MVANLSILRLLAFRDAVAPLIVIPVLDAVASAHLLKEYRIFGLARGDHQEDVQSYSTNK
jgi:hypothetical protein